MIKVSEGCMGASMKEQRRMASDRERLGVGRGSRCMLASGASSQARSAWLPRLTAANSSSTTLVEHPTLHRPASLMTVLGTDLALQLIAGDYDSQFEGQDGGPWVHAGLEEGSRLESRRLPCPIMAIPGSTSMWGNPGCLSALACSWLRLPGPHQHHSIHREVRLRPLLRAFSLSSVACPQLDLSSHILSWSKSGFVVHTQRQHMYTQKSTQQLMITFLRAGRMHVVDIKKVHVSHIWGNTSNQQPWCSASLVPVSCVFRAPYWCKTSQGKLWLYGSGTRYHLTDGGHFSSKGIVGVERCTGLELNHWTRRRSIDISNISSWEGEACRPVTTCTARDPEVRFRNLPSTIACTTVFASTSWIIAAVVLSLQLDKTHAFLPTPMTRSPKVPGPAAQMCP